MTRLLDEAFSLARSLPDDRQDELAARILAELAQDDDFDRAVAATADQLDWLIDEALAEEAAGLTREMRCSGYGSAPMRSTTG